MTTEQVQERFDVLFDGRGYLCIPAVPMRRDPEPEPKRCQVTYSVDEIRARVTAAMPGTLRQIMDGSGCREHQIYHVVQYWRRRGQLEVTGQRPTVVYAWVPAIRPLPRGAR